MGGIISSGENSGAKLTKKVELLKQTPFFVLFDETEINEVAKYFRLESIQQGGIVEQQAFLVVVEGELSISTLIPHVPVVQTTKNKTHVSELLGLKKKGDFFTKAGKELGPGASSKHHSAPGHGPGSGEKVIQTFDFTTVRAMADTTLLILEEKKKVEYLNSHSVEEGSVLSKILGSDIRAMLRPISFLRSIDTNKLATLAELFTYVAYPAGEVVMKEGDIDDDFFLVLGGTLAVFASVTVEDVKSQSVAKLVESENEEEVAKSASKVDLNIIKESEEATDNNKDDVAPFSLSNPDVKKVHAAPAPAASPKNKSVPVLKPLPSVRLLRKSSVQMHSETNSVQLAEIKTGGYFGELGMMVRMPRTATVRSTDKTLLARIKGKDFKKFLMYATDVNEAIKKEAKMRMVRKLCAFKLPFFAGIASSRLMELANVCTLKECAPGTVILNEGDISGVFYIVVHGLVDVVRDNEVIVRLAQGAYFGEISMLTGNPHCASVVANSHVVLLAVSYEGFVEFFQKRPQMLAEFEIRVLGSKQVTLNHVLKHALGCELFRQHLQNEFTIEHLDFYLAVEDFRAGQGKLTEAEIISSWVGENSKVPVNISSALVAQTLANESGPNKFDAAQLEIFNLMKRDNFSRFKKTVLFQELMESMNCYSDSVGEELSVDMAAVHKADISQLDQLITPRSPTSKE